MCIRLLAVIAAVTLTVGCSDSSSQTRAAEKAPSATKTAPSGLKGFGRGIYTTTGADYARIAELIRRREPITHASPSSASTVIVDPATAALDEIDSHGLTAMIYLGGYDKDACTFKWTDARVSQRVDLVKDHQASGMYYIADEPHTHCPRSSSRFVGVVSWSRASTRLQRQRSPRTRPAASPHSPTRPT